MDRTGHAEVLRQAAEAEFRTRVLIGQLAAGLAQQLVHRHIASRHAQQVAVDHLPAVADLALAGDLAHIDRLYVAHALFVQGLEHGAVGQATDLALGQRAGQRLVGAGMAQVDDGGDVHALVMQVEGGEVTVVVAGEHHRAFAGLDRIEFHQALRGTGQHHPRQVVVAKDHRLVERAAAHQALSRAHLVHALALDHRQVVVGEPGVARRLGQHLDIRVLPHRVEQFTAQGIGAGPGDVEARIGQRAAEDRLLFDQQHLGPGVGGGQRRLQTGGAGTDDGEVGEQVGLVVVLGLELQVEHAQAGLFADDRLPDFPHALGLVERAVIEAHRHEFGELAHIGVAVVVQRAVDVLRGHRQAVGQRVGIGQHVGFLGQLHQAVGVLAGHAQRPAWAVVFERARHQKAPIGEQGTGDAVALQALVGLAIETELERLIAVDQQAHGGGEAVHPAISWVALKSTRWVNSSLGSKVRRISSVTVWRSARNQ